jgi:hypothetical protein
MNQSLSKNLLNKVVTGAIKCTIQVHGDITSQTISSASKRITGELVAILARAGIEVTDEKVVNCIRNHIGHETEIKKAQCQIEKLNQMLKEDYSDIKKIKINKKIEFLKQQVRRNEIIIAFM